MSVVSSSAATEAPRPSVWTGRSRAHAIKLDISYEECQKRFNASQPTQVAAAMAASTRWQQFWDAFVRETDNLSLVLASAPPDAPTRLEHRVIPYKTGPAERVHREVVGFRYDGRHLLTRLPQVRPRAFALPGTWAAIQTTCLVAAQVCKCVAVSLCCSKTLTCLSMLVTCRRSKRTTTSCPTRTP